MKMKVVSPRWSEELEFLYRTGYARAKVKEIRLTGEKFFDRALRKGLEVLAAENEGQEK